MGIPVICTPLVGTRSASFYLYTAHIADEVKQHEVNMYAG